jgi:hypothetical protein
MGDDAPQISPADPYGEEGERYCSISPRMIWDAIEAAWDAGLLGWNGETPDWDLRAAGTCVKAKDLALGAIAKAIEEHPG